MSFKVLVIPEDPTHNGYILKPLVEALMAEAGRPAAKVDILVNPKLNGFDHAVAALRRDLADRYGHWDLWLFIPDADRASPDAMRALEADLNAKGIRLLCCPAQPEVELYACAAFRDDIKETWEQARANPRMKEEVFQPLLDLHGDARRAGAGRDTLIKESLRNLPLLFQLCPELGHLCERIRHVVEVQ